jgi:hypothetical protein
MLCEACKKDFPEDEIYTFEGKQMCEDCAIDKGLFPLGHTGLRRDKIAEKGRRLTLPKHDED